MLTPLLTLSRHAPGNMYVYGAELGGTGIRQSTTALFDFRTLHAPQKDLICMNYKTKFICKIFSQMSVTLPDESNDGN